MSDTAKIITSRQRVLQTLDHKESDRLPRDFDAEEPLINALCKQLSLPDVTALRDYFKVDMHKIWVTYKSPYTDGRDIWGIKLESSSDGATLKEANHPLAGVTTVEEVKAYAWPSPDSVDLGAIKQQVADGRKKNRFVVCSSWGSIFSDTCNLMSMDNFMIALHERPEVVYAVIAELKNFFLEVDLRIFTSCKGLIDMAYYGNDMGTQRSLLLSRQMFNQFFTMPLKELVDQAKSFGLRAMMHSCGAVSEIIPDIINCGFDALDPVQYTASGMLAKVLKDKFGQSITFHGCISAQKILPSGSVSDVCEHVREVCEIMKPGGGYIFTSDQAITRDVPVENVLEMYRAIDDCGY